MFVIWFDRDADCWCVLRHNGYARHFGPSHGGGKPEAIADVLANCFCLGGNAVRRMMNAMPEPPKPDGTPR